MPGKPRIAALFFASLLPLLTSGCMRTTHQASIDLALATAPVLDQAAAAYRSANDIHNTELQYEAYEAFGKTPPYRPENIEPLLSQHDIDVRLAVLCAFQLYVDNIVQLTEGSPSPQLAAASTSAGRGLTSFGNTMAPTVEGALHITPPAPTLNPDGSSAPQFGAPVQNGISTAVVALGQYLASRKLRQELPGRIKTMDAQLQPLWTLLQSDIDILGKRERHDYEEMIAGDTNFLLTTPSLAPDVRRQLIMSLPEIVWKQRDSANALAQLSASIRTLAAAHAALAQAAQPGNPESLKGKISDLAAAGTNLGKFYSSLPSQ